MSRKSSTSLVFCVKFYNTITDVKGHGTIVNQERFKIYAEMYTFFCIVWYNVSIGEKINGN